MKSHNQLKEILNISLRILDMPFSQGYVSAWAYVCRLSMSIDFIDLLHRNFRKTHLTYRWVSTVVHAVCFKGYDDAWSCEFRIKNTVGGHAFWRGISPLRSYSTQYSRSPWKGILECNAERFEKYLRSKTLITSKTCRPGGSAEAGVCRMWRALGSEAEWHSVESLKCHFKLTDGAFAAGVWGECWSTSGQPSVIHKLFNIIELHLLECLRDTRMLWDAERKWRQAKEQTRA